MENQFNHAIVESLILASPEPLPLRKLVEMGNGLTPSRISQAVAELNNKYMTIGSSFRIREIAGGYQYHIIPEFSGYVEELYARRRKLRLTRAALETLAIVAYRQPVTKVEIEQIRGVGSDGVLTNLLEKSLVAITGRAASIGKPLQYGTTTEFLKFFGLNSLEDLPKMSEIEALIAANDKSDEAELSIDAEGNLFSGGLSVGDNGHEPEMREAFDRAVEGVSLRTNSRVESDVNDEDLAEPVVEREVVDIDRG